MRLGNAQMPVFPPSLREPPMATSRTGCREIAFWRDTGTDQLAPVTCSAYVAALEEAISFTAEGVGLDSETVIEGIKLAAGLAHV